MVFEGISSTKKKLLETSVDEKPKPSKIYPPFRTGGNITIKEEKKQTKTLV